MKRPLSVTVIGGLFIMAGMVGFVYHLSDRPVRPELVLISVIRIAAVVGGIFLTKGHNWARWLLLGWMGFHVVVSAFHSLPEFMAHVALIAVIGYVLLRPPVSKFFELRPKA